MRKSEVTHHIAFDDTQRAAQVLEASPDEHIQELQAARELLSS